jgi:Ner family transcriptional regulator
MDVDMKKTAIPTDTEKRWEWIKYQLRTNDTSLAKLARQMGVSGAAVKNAKLTAYPRMERAIANALGLLPATIWPERWDTENNVPRRIRSRRAERNANYSQDLTPRYVHRHRKTGAGD